jgi:hypothetical protein
MVWAFQLGGNQAGNCREIGRVLQWGGRQGFFEDGTRVVRGAAGNMQHGGHVLRTFHNRRQRSGHATIAIAHWPNLD